MSNLSGKMNIKKISKGFWEQFMEIESLLYDNIKKRDIIEYNKSINMVNAILKKLEINCMINIQFGIGTRNGMILDERKDSVEIILSPMFQRNNQDLMHTLYDESFNKNLPEYWSVIKYKFHRTSFIHTISLNYNDPNIVDNNIVQITKDDFSYFPIFNDEKTKLSIILFIDDKKSKYLVKKQKVKIKDIERELFIPIDNGIHAMIDSAIGEYNLLNVLDKIEIYTKSELETDEFKEINAIKMENLIYDIDMIHNNSLNPFEKCGRCEYSNKNVELHECNCKKIYYCDSICKNAHQSLHTLSGCI